MTCQIGNDPSQYVLTRPDFRNNTEGELCAWPIRKAPQNPPHLGLSDTEWTAYCARELNFTEVPVYGPGKWVELEQIEHNAIAAGFELIVRTTVHNGQIAAICCPYWQQITSWLFGLPGYGLVIRIQYWENISRNLSDGTPSPLVSELSAIYCAAPKDCKNHHVLMRVPERFVISDGMSDACSIQYTIMYCYGGTEDYDQRRPNPGEHTDVPKLDDSVDNNAPAVLFSPHFWAFFTVMKPYLAPRIPNIQITSWSGSHSLPGHQTENQSRLGWVTTIAYLNRLLKSRLSEWTDTVWGCGERNRIAGNLWTPRWQSPPLDKSHVMEGLVESGEWLPIQGFGEHLKTYSFDFLEIRLSPNAGQVVKWIEEFSAEYT